VANPVGLPVGASAQSGWGCTEEGEFFGVLSCYPGVLAKACCDDFVYVLETTGGTRIRFEAAEPISATWVHLRGAHLLPREFDPKDGQAYWLGQMTHVTDYPNFDRGLDLQVASIAWIADCPEGS